MCIRFAFQFLATQPGKASFAPAKLSAPPMHARQKRLLLQGALHPNFLNLTVNSEKIQSTKGSKFGTV